MFKKTKMLKNKKKYTKKYKGGDNVNKKHTIKVNNQNTIKVNNKNPIKVNNQNPKNNTRSQYENVKNWLNGKSKLPHSNTKTHQIIMGLNKNS